MLVQMINKTIVIHRRSPAYFIPIVIVIIIITYLIPFTASLDYKTPHNLFFFLFSQQYSLDRELDTKEEEQKKKRFAFPC